MTPKYVWLNDGLVPGEQASVSVFDRGLLYGDGLFETMRAYGGQVFRLRQHLARLRRSAAQLAFPRPPSMRRTERAVRETLAANDLAEAYVRVTLTRGVGGDPSELTAAGEPTLVVITREYSPRPELYDAGVSAAVASSVRPADSHVPRVKSLNYLQCLLESAAARQDGHYEAIFCDDVGNVLEGATTNVFMADDGEVRAPAEDGDFLEGITLECVAEACERLGIPLRREDFIPTDIARADEAFLTNSLIEIVPLVYLAPEPDDVAMRIGTGAPGEITGRILSEYRRMVERECGV